MAMQYIDVTGKTEAEAVEKALGQLGLDRDDVSVEILERAKSGFLGIGASPAKVRVTYEVAEEAAPAAEEAGEEDFPQRVEKSQAPRAERRRRERRPREKREQPAEKKSEKAQQSAPAPAPAPVELGEEADDEKARQIRDFLTGLLEHMDSAAVIKVYQPEKDRYKVFLEGEKMGQLIGATDAPISAPVHASVSGKVVAVEPRRHMLGDMVMSVVIENDFQDTPCEDLKPLTEGELKDPEAIIRRIREAGITGMGGAMFPTAFKISSGRGKVDTLIINGAECEPYLCGDHRTMLEHPEELLKGIELVRIAHGLDKCYYGIEKNKQDAIDLLMSLDPAKYGVEIVPEEVKYPQGAEKLQVKANTNREVKPGGLPSGVGANVVSTYTCYTIYRACYEGVPSIERVVTVAGDCVSEAQNLLVRFGTPLEHIFAEAGADMDKVERICMGGPMMGICVADPTAGSIKGASGLLLFSSDMNRESETPTCIRCGNCVAHCPMKLEPIYMYMYVQKGDIRKMEEYHVMDCFECGSCSWGCPGRLPLTHTFKLGKAMINAHRAEEKAKAEAAKINAAVAAEKAKMAAEGKEAGA